MFSLHACVCFKSVVNTNTAIKVPVGTTGQRPTASQGQIRYNTTTSTFEGYTGSTWGSLGGVIDSAHGSNTFVIAGKVASASVSVVNGMISSNEVGTDDTLSFFTGTTAGSAEGIRKVTVDRDNFKIYDNADSTTVKFSVNNSGNTTRNDITHARGHPTTRWLSRSSHPE